MTLLWRPQLNTGNELIDCDHRHLVCLINTIELTLQRPEHRDLLGAAIEQLVDYTRIHFEHEERIMIALRYIGFDAHKAKHDDLRKQLARIHGEMGAAGGAEPPAALVEQLTGLLRNWLVDHIIKEDFQLRPLLASKTPQFTASYG